MEELGNFSIIVDPMRQYTEVRLDGFLDTETVTRFDGEYRAAKARLKEDTSKHVTLIDVSQLKIQAQNVVSDFALMLSDPSIRSAKLAFVTGDAPAKMQLRRLVNDNAQMFDTMEQARAWLFAGSDD
jgi:hypothetical protein